MPEWLSLTIIIVASHFSGMIVYRWMLFGRTAQGRSPVPKTMSYEDYIREEYLKLLGSAPTFLGKPAFEEFDTKYKEFLESGSLQGKPQTKRTIIGWLPCFQGCDVPARVIEGDVRTTDEQCRTECEAGHAYTIYRDVWEPKLRTYDELMQTGNATKGK